LRYRFTSVGLDPQILACGGVISQETAFSITGRKEVIYMINTVTSIDTVITDVEEIEVKPMEKQDQRVARTIVIRTRHKEIYTLLLYADCSLDLDLRRDSKDREKDWLMPKVYKGKSMTELGEDYEE
jgi:hypothetical protein